jgi:hypothetical protein
MKIQHPLKLAAAFAGLQFACLAVADSGHEGTSAPLPANTVVSPSNLHGWVFGNDGAPMGSATFAAGPGTAPLGAGSVELSVADAIERLVLATGAHAGTRLDSLAVLKYSTWQTTGTASVSLQLDVDFDLSDASSAWQGTLVFEPSLNGTVTPGQWQTWDGFTGKWYMTGTAISAGVPAGQPFPLATPGTLAQILAAFPNAGIRTTVGALSLRSGGPAGASTVNVDAVVIGLTGGDTTTYNFEPDSDGDGVPDSEDHCPDSDVRPKVDVGGGATTIDNTADDDGCTIQDLVNKAQLAATNHGKYVSAIAKLANDLRKAKTITNDQSKEMKTGSAQSTIGKPPVVPPVVPPTGTGGNNGNGNNGNGNGNGHGHNK